MSQPLLTTRFYPSPLPAQWTPRPRLTALLETGRNNGHALTCISAPAGTGKTGLVVEWLQNKPCTVWLTLENSENDPAQFWTCVLAALQTILPGFGEDLAAGFWLPATPRTLRVTLIDFIQRIDRLPEPIVLVLDDLHRIQNQSIFADLEYLIDHLPGTLHLVLLTRSAIPVPLARLRAVNRLTEITAAELRFTPAETRAFFQRWALSDSTLNEIYQQLEGWAAGYQLTALALGEPSAAPPRITFSSQPYLLDFLTEEVLQRQPTAIQDFLLRTALLDQFSAALCSAMLAAPAADMLSQVEHANLFLVPLNPERTWFRYQHVFAGLLRERAARMIPHTEICCLHSRAAAWLEQNDFLHAAIHHALAGEDLPAALRLAERCADQDLHSGHIQAFLQLLETIPIPALETAPLLRLRQARALRLNGQHDAAWDLLREIETISGPDMPQTAHSELLTLKAMLASTSLPPDQAAAVCLQALDSAAPADRVLRARLHILRAALYRLEARLDEAAADCLEARRLARAARSPYLEMHTLENLAVIRLQAGDLSGAETLCAEVRAAGHPAGLALTVLASVELERNQLDDAEIHRTEAEQIASAAGLSDVQISAALLEVRLQAVRGNASAAMDALHRAASLLQDSSASFLPILIDLQSRRLKRIFPRQTGFPVTAAVTTPLPRGLQLAVRMIQAHETLPSPADLSIITADCKALNLLPMQIEALLLETRTHIKMNEHNIALDRLKTALCLAEPAGMIRIFLDEADILPLLAECTDHPLARTILSAAPTKMASPAGLLSPREREILSLIASGRTNHEIAERLFLTENTVKKHTSHIFAKLGTSNRTGALLRARELGLLE